MGFPQLRLRRLRRTRALRQMVREARLDIADLVFPLFVVEGKKIRHEIDPMPGICRFSIDLLADEVQYIYKLGIPAVILFGIPGEKDDLGRAAYDPGGIAQEAIRTIKKIAPELLVITDVCLCEYTTHGHCGIVASGELDNDRTLELLARIALSHAESGADIVAPSAMMDGQVQAIRKGLDEAGFTNTAILSYAAKHASAFYGPFREAAQSTPQFGDRCTYQTDPANVREALREVEQDEVEGADMVMVKPALAFLDVIKRVRESSNHPLAVYNVSGEYSMVKAAAQRGWIDERSIVLEILTAIKRAGADIIITYHAKDVATWLA